MLVKIWAEDNKDVDLYHGEVDQIEDRGGCIRWVSLWPKPWISNNKAGATPFVSICARDGTTVRVLDMTDIGEGHNPVVALLRQRPPATTGPAADIAENMKDFWAHQAAQSEVG